jgi:hypothetical protein
LLFADFAAQQGHASDAGRHIKTQRAMSDHVSRTKVHYSVLANGVLPAIAQVFFERMLVVAAQAPGAAAAQEIAPRLAAIKDDAKAQSDFYETPREKVSERCSGQLKNYVYAVRLDSGINSQYVGNNPDDDVTASSRDFYGHVFDALCSRMIRTPGIYFNELQRAKVCELALEYAGSAAAAMVGYDDDGGDAGGGGGGGVYHPGGGYPQAPTAYRAEPAPPAPPRAARPRVKSFTFQQ